MRKTIHIQLLLSLGFLCFLNIGFGQLSPNLPGNTGGSSPLTQKSTLAANINSSQDIVEIKLVDESLPQVLEILEKLTGKTIIRKSGLPAAKINFNSQKGITKDEAINGLISALTLNGVAITEISDQLLKAVPTLGVNSESPEIIYGSTLDLSPSEKIVSKVFKLNYLPVKESIPSLTPFMSKGTGSLIPFYTTNSVLITDSIINLQRFEKLFAKIDQPIQMREEIHFYQLKNISAADLQNRLNKMKEGALNNYLGGATFFEADDRTNQLIIVTHTNNLNLIQRVIDNLDIDVQPVTKSDVFYLKHAPAVKVAEVLQKIIDGQKQKGEKNSNDNLVKDLKKAENNKTPDNTSDNSQFSSVTTIVADERSNAIVSYGMPGDLRQIHRLIEKLDILLSQVSIEVVIAEVRLLDGQTRGLESFGLNFNLSPTGGLLGSVLSANQVAGGSDLSYGATSGSPVLNGGSPAITVSSLGTIKNFNLQTVFNTAKRKDNVRILSSPTILTTHNKKGVINVSEVRPFLTAQLTQNITPNVTTNSVDYKDVGIKLEVTPLVGNNGIIQMDIKQTVKDINEFTTVGTSPATAVSIPIVNTREAESFVSVENSEVVVLAGLQQVGEVKQKRKVFLLGDLPLIGDKIFTRRTLTSEIRELIFFIKPTFIAHPNDNNCVTEQIIENSYNQETLNHYFDYGHFKQQDCFKPVSEECYEDEGLNDFNLLKFDDDCKR